MKFVLKKSEIKVFGLSAFYFFFLLFGYYLLRPLREEMGIRGGIDQLPWLWTGTTSCMLLLAPVYATLVSRTPRKTFIPIVYRFFAIQLAAFFLFFKYMKPENILWLGYVFYIWLSVFNLFSVSLFWSLMADLWNEEQGKRLFGAIGVGGTLGAILGSSVPAYLAKYVGILPLFLISALMLEICVHCVSRITKSEMFGSRSAQKFEPGPAAFEGFRLIFRSPYLLMIVVYILIFTITNAFVYFSQAEIVSAAYSDSLNRTALFGKIDMWVNILTITTQAVGTGPLLKRFGLSFGLSIMPIVSLLGFAGLAFQKSIAVLVAFVVLRRAAHYAVDRPAREVLFTILGPDEKYKSKSFLDTFVFRAGDLSGAWLSKLGATIVATALPISFLWWAVALYVSKKHHKLATH